MAAEDKPFRLPLKGERNGTGDNIVDGKRLCREFGMPESMVVSEAEIRRFLGFCADGYWGKADGRTHEGKAQKAALAMGWIEPLGLGTGYRLIVQGR